MNKNQKKIINKDKIVRISVRGGVAYLDKCPKGVKVVIKDYDNDGR